MGDVEIHRPLETKCQEIQGEIGRLRVELRSANARYRGFEEANTLLIGEAISALARKRIEDKIRKERHGLEEIEAKIRDAEATLTAYQETQRMLSRESCEQSEPTLRANTELAKIRDFIRTLQRPVDLSEILGMLQKEDTSLTRNSLRGSISRYAKTNTIFVKTAPNTFGLTELGHKSPIMETDPT